MRLSNRVVLITGGNRGIGLAAARLFAKEGAKEMLFARDQAKGKSEAETIPNAGFIQGDVTKAEDCQRAVADRSCEDAGPKRVWLGSQVLWRSFWMYFA